MRYLRLLRNICLAATGLSLATGHGHLLFRAEKGAELRKMELKEGSALPLLIWPMPAYPFDMRRAAVTGEATAEILVLPNGRVSSVRVLHATHPDFARGVEAALNRWLFAVIQPRNDATPRGARFECTLAFELDEDD